MHALYEGDESFDPSLVKSEAVTNIWDRYHDIVDLFPDDLKKRALPFFIDWLLENVHIVKITAYSDADAYTVFETMNDRGLSLTATEMLRDTFFQRLRLMREKSLQYNLETHIAD